MLNGGSDTKTTSKTITTTSTSKESTETLARVEDTSEDLKESADALLKKGTNSLFEKKSVTDKEGNITYAYDTDKIYAAVKDFTEKYNSLVAEVEDSGVSGIKSAASSMIRMTKVNEKSLNEIGITIGEDNKLSISEEDFKNADMAQMKSMFNTTVHTVIRCRHRRPLLITMRRMRLPRPIHTITAVCITIIIIAEIFTARRYK